MFTVLEFHHIRLASVLQQCFVPAGLKGVLQVHGGWSDDSMQPVLTVKVYSPSFTVSVGLWKSDMPLLYFLADQSSRVAVGARGVLGIHGPPPSGLFLH